MIDCSKCEHNKSYVPKEYCGYDEGGHHERGFKVSKDSVTRNKYGDCRKFKKRSWWSWLVG